MTTTLTTSTTTEWLRASSPIAASAPPPAAIPCPTITASQLVSLNNSSCSRNTRPLARNMSSLAASPGGGGKARQ